MTLSLNGGRILFFFFFSPSLFQIETTVGTHSVVEVSFEFLILLHYLVSTQVTGMFSHTWLQASSFGCVRLW